MIFQFLTHKQVNPEVLMDCIKLHALCSSKKWAFCPFLCKQRKYKVSKFAFEMFDWRMFDRQLKTTVRLGFEYSVFTVPLPSNQLHLTINAISVPSFWWSSYHDTQAIALTLAFLQIFAKFSCCMFVTSAIHYLDSF